MSDKNLLVIDRDEIAFELREGKIVIPVTINGNPFNVCIDTGAYTTILDSGRASANNFDLNNAEHSSVTGLGGKLESKRILLKTFQIGQCIFKNVETEITELPGVLRRNMDGFIGWKILRYFKVTIDYENKLLVLERTGIAE